MKKLCLDMVKTNNKYRQLEGKKFGRLTVLERDWTQTSSKNNWRVYWKCQCDCGKIKSVRAEHLKLDGKQYHTQSCGCFQKEKASQTRKSSALPLDEYFRRCIYHTYKKGAESKNLTFTLSRDIFDTMIGQPCFYCGNLPNNIRKHSRNKNDIFIYNGIDRKDPTKGYDTENVVTCCSQCNYAKLDYNMHDFFEWIKKIYNHLKERNLL